MYSYPCARVSDPFGLGEGGRSLVSRLFPKWVWSLFGVVVTPLIFVLAIVIFERSRRFPFVHPSWIWLGAIAGLALLGGYVASRAVRLVEQAERDALTGLYSRYVWEPAVIRHISGHPQRPLSLMLIDIDNFKEYNDRFGHLVGDQIIQQVANSLSKLVRSTDIVGRYGGDEFIIVLPNVDRATSHQIAERLVRELATTMDDWAGRHGVNPSPTISVGVAITDSISINSPAHLLDRADQALYKAKLSGNSVSYAC